MKISLIIIVTVSLYLKPAISLDDYKFSNIKQLCRTFGDFKKEFMWKHYDLKQLNTRVKQKIDKDFPIMQNYESKRDEYPTNRITKMLNLKYTTIKEEFYPIYKKTPFDDYSLNFLTKGHRVFNTVQSIGSCYSYLLNSHYWYDFLKRINSESTNYLNSMSQLYENFDKNTESTCPRQAFLNIFRGMVDDYFAFTPKANHYISEQEKYMKLQYKCDMDPVNEAIKYAPMVSGLIDPFYTKMNDSMSPYFENIKAQLQDIVLTHESYQKYDNDSQRYKTELGDLKFSEMVYPNEVETQRLLASTEEILRSMNGYISNELLASLTAHINNLKNQIELSKQQNESISEYEREVATVNEGINELSRFVPDLLGELSSVAETAKQFIGKIDEGQLNQDIKDYVFDRKQLDLEIENFLKENNDLLEVRLKSLKAKFTTLSSDIDAKMSKLKQDKNTLNNQNTENNRIFQKESSDLNGIISHDIPIFEKGLNTQLKNEKLNVEDPSGSLNDVIALKNDLLDKLNKYESEFENNLLDSVDGYLRHSRATLDKINDANTVFERFLTAHTSSMLWLKGDEQKRLYTDLSSRANEEINTISPKVVEWQSKIDNVLASIVKKREMIRNILQQTQKVKSDYADIKKVQNDLSEKLNIPYLEFNALVSDRVGSLNLNLKNDVTKIAQDINEYKKEVKQIQDQVANIVKEVDILKTEATNLLNKTNNMKNVHTNMVESVTHSIRSVEKFNFDDVEKLKTQFNNKIKQIEESLKEYLDKNHLAVTYYGSSVDEAKNLIKKITENHENEKINKLIQVELSIDRNLKPFEETVNEYGVLITKTDNNVKQLKSEYDQLSTNVHNEKLKYEENLKLILSKFENYNKFENNNVLFTSDTAVSRLLEENSTLQEKSDLSKSITNSLHQQVETLTSIIEKINGKVDGEVTSIRNKVEAAEALKPAHAEYIEKLKVLKNASETIKQALNQLNNKKGLLSTFPNTLEHQKKKNLNEIEKYVTELSANGKSKIELLQNAESEVFQKFTPYEKLHKDLKSKANTLSVDISTDLENKYISLVEEYTELKSKLNEKEQTITKKLSEGSLHYANQEEKLNKTYSVRMSNTDDFIKKIENLIQEFTNTGSFDLDNMNILTEKLSKLVTDIDNFYAANNGVLSVEQFKAVFDASIPSDLNLFKSNVEKAKDSDKNFRDSLGKNTESPQINNQPDNQTQLNIHDDKASNESTTDSDTYSAISGESRNVASKDYFKIIIAGAAIAIICLVIGGAILKYKSIKKNQIYDKCENIYVKV